MSNFFEREGRLFLGKVFPTEEALKKHLKEHPKADPSKHSVKGEGDKGKDKEEAGEEKGKAKGEEGGEEKAKGEKPKAKLPVPEPHLLSKDRDATEEDIKKWNDSVAKNDLAKKYHLDLVAGPPDGKVTVNDLIRAQHVAEAAIAKIEEDASRPEGDLCAVRPGLCQGNKGIDRSSMPQLMEEPIGVMLDSDNPKDRKKAQAYIDAAKAQGKSEEEIKKLISSNKAPKDAFIESLIDEVGIIDEPAYVPVRELKATQKNIKANKSYGMAQSYLLAEDSPYAKPDPETGEKKGWSPFEAEIIISKDGYILDGHHRWAAGVISNPDKPMKVKRINMNMDELLSQSFEFPGTFRADINDNIIPNDKPLDLARKPGETWKQPAGYYGKNKEGESQGPFKTEEQAKAYASGKKAKKEEKKKAASFEEGGEMDGGEILSSLLGRLKALYWFHWTAHWQTSGTSFYGDHLLFERMKDEIAEEIDGLAERVVGYHGGGAVDPWHIMEHEHEGMAPEGSGDDLPGQALAMEMDFLAELEEAHASLEEIGGLTLGLDDFLPAMASTHDTHVYLLQQRLGGKVASNEWQEEPTRHAEYDLEGVEEEWLEWEGAGMMEG